MCGIAGFYYASKADDRQDLQARLDVLLKALHHRGPDDRGNAVFPRCALGMTRLSIIDLKTGHQPMFAEGKRYAVVFNGEIYNFREIRTRLQSEGVAFETHSDTEVIVQGYARWGASVVSHLDGMFAFAIYDARKHELFVARDRVGKKPFYFFWDQNQFAFCSEIRALMKSRQQAWDIDLQAYWDFLTYRYAPDGETAVQGIRKLPPGHFAVVGPDGLRITRYWDFPVSDSKRNGDKDLAGRFGRLFSRAVEKRLIADVPVGVILSGGIDSCAVLHEASRFQKVDSFHVHFTFGGNYSELRYAEIMAKAAGSKLHAVSVEEKQFLDKLDALCEITDEPLADLSAIPLQFICALARQHIKVGLTGEGSDEALAGYGLHGFFRRFRWLKALQRIPAASNVLKAVASVPGAPGRLRVLGYPADEVPRRKNFNITFHATQKMKQDLRLGPDLGLLDSVRILEDRYREVEGEDALNQMLQVISRDWLAEDVLMKSDKVSMSVSLELRCPFLDRELLEFVFSLPGDRKIGKVRGRLESKALLKTYLQGKIPDEILFRKKLGFPVPAYALQTRQHRDYVAAALSSESCFYARLFDRAKVARLMERAFKEPPGEETQLKHFIWNLVTFENWFRSNKEHLAS